MAVLNIRLDEHSRDQLKELATRDGVSLSEYCRTVLDERVAPVPKAVAGNAELEAPDTLPLNERRLLSLLHRILARVLPEDANDEDGDRAYQLELAELLEQGYAREYWREYAGMASELPKWRCEQVVDILQMFRSIKYSVDRLAGEEEPLHENIADGLEFLGFDHNDSLEGSLAQYVDFIMRDNRWTELKPQLERNDDGNSHMPMLDVYLRMLGSFRGIMDSRDGRFSPSDYLLSMEELHQIADQRVHPSNRRHFRSITRWNGVAALIKMPSDDAIVPSRLYEIRDVDRRTVLTKDVKGQELVDARQQQLAQYLNQAPGRSNLAMVDVSTIIDSHRVDRR